MNIKEYEQFHRRSLEDTEGCWTEQARGIEQRKRPASAASATPTGSFTGR